VFACSRRALPLIVLPLSVLLTGCSGIFGACESIQIANLIVVVRDSATGRPAAQGATGFARHRDGVTTELTASFDSLTLFGNWARELAGRYSIEVRKPGYRTARMNTEVEEDRCHVRQQTVPVALARDPNAMEQSPIRFTLQGPRFPGDRSSAGIRVMWDTLQIVGSADARCSQLRSVAYRTNDFLHVQLEPVTWLTQSCGGPHLQQYELRFKLNAGHNYILVTTGVYFPTVLFDGRVTAPVAPDIPLSPGNGVERTPPAGALR
jgi:hypothetical protein